MDYALQQPGVESYTVFFGPEGGTSECVLISILEDSISEGMEVFSLVLETDSPVTDLSPDVANVTIIDNDGRLHPIIWDSIIVSKTNNLLYFITKGAIVGFENSNYIAEEGTLLSVCVELNIPIEQIVTVNIFASDVSATGEYNIGFCKYHYKAYLLKLMCRWIGFLSYNIP